MRVRFIRNQRLVVAAGIAIVALAILTVLLADGENALQGTAADPPEVTAEPTIADDNESVASEPTTDVPTDIPSASPTEVPSEAPTDVPSEVPTEVPSEAPTEVPSEVPTVVSSEVPDGASLITVPEVPADVEADPIGCQMSIDDAGDTNPFTFNFAAVNTQDIASYRWDVDNDGTDESTDQTTSYSYPTTGTFTVKLYCTPNGGLPDLELTGSVTITADPPEANFVVNPASLSGFAPLDVYLTNTSTGSELDYEWIVTGPENFGPVMTTNASFTFTQIGNYTITLTVTDGINRSDAGSITVIVSEPPPEVNFNLSPISGTAPLIVTVEGVHIGGGAVSSWSWDFGGLGTATGQGPHTFEFTAEGTYAIELEVHGPGGTATVQKEIGVFPDLEPVTAEYTYELMGEVVAGTIRVCFTNISEGPVTQSVWTFGSEGTVTDNSAVVCHDFSAEGDYLVNLEVTGTDPDVTSNRQKTIDVVGAPVAVIGTSTTEIAWRGTVDFTGSGSTGSINTYEWDFNDDGVIDSTDADPSGIEFGTIGGNTVRLTVTGDGGTSTAEVVITVSVRAITCDFSGPLSVLPGGNGAYNASIGEAMGRTITYAWTVNGDGISDSYSTADISQSFGANEAAYTVTLSAEADDGASCVKTKTVQVEWQQLTCSLNRTGNPWPNSSLLDFTVTPANVDGRTVEYVWYVDTVDQMEPLSTTAITRSWATEGTHSVRVVGTTADGDECEDTVTVDVAWPVPVCSINGPGSFEPRMPDDNTRTANYSVGLSGLAGRSVSSYQWTVTDPSNATTNLGTTSAQSLHWEWDELGNYTVAVVATIDNGDGTFTDCRETADLSAAVGARRSTNVYLNDVSCSVSGDRNPVVNETVTYQLNVNNRYMRTVTDMEWRLTRDSDGVVVTSHDYPDVAGAPSLTIGYQFLDAGETYTLTYSYAVDTPVDGCSGSIGIGVPSQANMSFTCDAWNGGNVNPIDPAGSYAYTVEIDNTNAIDLRYRWYRVYKDSSGADVEEVFLAEQANIDIDGIVTSPDFSGGSLGPVADHYTLRVHVSAMDSAETDYTCSLERDLVVGELRMNYTWNVTRTAVDVAEEICLTNTSEASHEADVNALIYTWDLGSAQNSLGTQTYSGVEPPCFSYDTPGNYVIRVTGTNASGRMTAHRQRTFNVYGSQSMAISRSDEEFAPTTMTFTANAVNLPGPYSWRFFNEAGSQIGTRTGGTVTYNFSTGQRYRVEVSGTGNLGTTSASAEFELLEVDDIRAAFRPTTYGGVAPLRVCFNDNSLGDTISNWYWDFGNGEVMNYNEANRPAEICTTYAEEATPYVATLRVENAGGLEVTATNVVRTYNLVERNASFGIQPQGSGRFCFYSILSPGLWVTRWQFGDGGEQTTGNLDYVCYTYAMSGTYLVTMHVTDGGETGEVTRPVTVDPGGSVPNPVLDVNHSCTTGSYATFEVTNTGDSMATSDRVTITDENGAVLYTDDSLMLNHGESRAFTVGPRGGVITFSTLDTSVSQATTCVYPPIIEATASCDVDGSAVFVVRNESGDTAANQSYEVRDGNNSLVTSGTLEIDANGVVTVRVSDHYGPLTLTSNGSEGPTTELIVNSNCAEPPRIEGSASCAVDGSAMYFVSNTSPSSGMNQNYEVRDADGHVVATGSIVLSPGENTTIQVTDSFGALTFRTSGPEGPLTELSLNTDCDEAPRVTSSAVCAPDGSAIFALTNVSIEASFVQGYEVRDENGEVVATGEINAEPGAMEEVAVFGTYGPLTFATVAPFSPFGEITLNTNCGEPPTLGASAVCAGQVAVFTITNTAESQASQSYTVTSVDSGELVAQGDVEVEGGGTATVTVEGVTGRFVLESQGEAGTTTRVRVEVLCPEAFVEPVGVLPTPAPLNRYFPEIDPITGEPDPGFERGEPWESIAIGGAVCDDWILYHTNMTGDWEVFRLGDIERYPDADPNLSQGRGEDVIDMAPTRSPDAEWVAFTSNRDGNWELYLTRVDNSDMRRLTHNTTAHDIDPAWSPDGRYIAFETSRDGNWELYLFDVSTGQEIRLTDSPGSDINAYWSSDSRKIVFQSDRDGLWQIYEIEIDSRQERRISDGEGEDHDPAYAFDGERVAFRSYRDGVDRSVIYVMNLDGTGLERISDPTAEAMNHTWYLDDSIIAYQSNLDGDFDIYVYEFDSRDTRLVTDNDIHDYAPTWICDAPIVVFTSDVTGDPNIFNTPALPIDAEPIQVDGEGNQMTFDDSDDVYPENAPTEENASREGNVPPRIGE